MPELLADVKFSRGLLVKDVPIADQERRGQSFATTRVVCVGPMSKVDKRQIGYWLTTGLVGLAIGAGGVFDALRPPEVLEITAHLGYPSYFILMLGIAKVLGALTILVPKLPRLKEWAYAGITIDLVAAAVSHGAVGDPVTDVVVPVIFLGLLMTSYVLRPDSRKLPDRA